MACPRPDRRATALAPHVFRHRSPPMTLALHQYLQDLAQHADLHGARRSASSLRPCGPCQRPQERPDTRFRIGSLSKSYTAAAILLLAAWQLDLHDSAARHLPDCGLDPRITPMHLLRHRSGLGNHTALPAYWPGTDGAAHRARGSDQADHRLAPDGHARTGLPLQQHRLRRAGPDRGTRRRRCAARPTAHDVLASAGTARDGIDRHRAQHRLHAGSDRPPRRPCIPAWHSAPTTWPRARATWPAGGCR